jgi:hypothetical protein
MMENTTNTTNMTFRYIFSISNDKLKLLRLGNTTNMVDNINTNNL